jgi:F-type H+-transporting ATPase subunit b
MIKRVALSAAFLLAALPAGAQESGGLNPFSGDVGNAFWTLAIFVLVVVVLGKFAWGPLLRLLQEREEFIHKALDDARRDRDDAESRLRAVADQLQAARAEAGQIVDKARRDAERLGEELRQRAREQADTILQNADRRIQQETDRALQQIRHEAVDLSVAIASKLIQRNLSKEDNQRLIDEALADVENRTH